MPLERKRVLRHLPLKGEEMKRDHWSDYETEEGDGEETKPVVVPPEWILE